MFHLDCPPSKSAPPLTLCSHFPDGLLLLEPQEESHLLRWVLLCFQATSSNTLALLLQSIEGLISHFSFLLSDHCLRIDLRRVSDVELANVLL